MSGALTTRGDDRRAGYLRAAFLNVYNLVALAGTSAAAVLTQDAWVLIAGLGAEAAWMLSASANLRFRRAIDARHAEERRRESLRGMQEQAALLPSEDRQRVQLVGSRAAEIKAECLRNPRLQGDFMKTQTDRLDELVGEFIRLALLASRCEAYLARADTREVARERDVWRENDSSAADDAARALARQNVAILDKRIALAEELGRFVVRARGQMALIQNTVALLRDQVMTMATPEVLTVQLDELVASVDALREATREVEAVVSRPVADPPLEEGGTGGRAPHVRV